MVDKISSLENTNKVNFQNILGQNKFEETREEKFEKISRKELEELVKEKNKELEKRKLEFKIHEKTGRIMVKMVDVETEEVIREIPPEKFLNLVGDIWEQVGIIVDERI